MRALCSKKLTLISHFYLISLESRDLLGFYCGASIVYDIMPIFNLDFNTKF